jgi:hypothetical protein
LGTPPHPLFFFVFSTAVGLGDYIFSDMVYGWCGRCSPSEFMIWRGFHFLISFYSSCAPSSLVLDNR